MKTRNVAQSMHRARCTRSPRRREKNCKLATRLVFRQRIRYNFFLSFFCPPPPFLSPFPFSLPQLVPHYTSNRIPSVVVVLINTLRAVRLACGGCVSAISIGRREFRYTCHPPPNDTLLPNIRRHGRCPATSPLFFRFCPFLRRVSRIFPPRCSLWSFTT